MSSYSRRGLLAGAGSSVVAASLVRSGQAVAMPLATEVLAGGGGVVLAVTAAAFARDPTLQTEYRACLQVPAGSTVIAAEIVVDTGSDPVQAGISPIFIETGGQSLYSSSMTVTNSLGPVSFPMNTPLPMLGTSALEIYVHVPVASVLHGAAIRYVPPASATTGSFVAGPVSRVVDTRVGLGGPAIANGEERVVGLPVSGSAAIFNLTVTDGEGPGFLAVYPAGTQWAGTSSINWQAAGATVAALVISATSTDKTVIVRGGVNKTHVIIDYVGSLA